MRYVLAIFRIGFGIYFIYMGAVKMMDVETFAKAIYRYDLISRELSHLVANILPSFEVITGISLLFGLFTRGGGALLALMNLVFFGCVLSALLRGLNIDCGCGGEPAPLTYAKLFENALGVVVGLFILFGVQDPLRMDCLLSKRLRWFGLHDVPSTESESVTS